MMIWEYEIWVWWFVKFGFCFFWFLIMMITWLIMVVLVFLDFICMRMNADWVLNYLFFYIRWNPSAKRFCGISLFASLLFKCLRNSNFFSPTNLPRKRMLLRWKESLLLLGRGYFIIEKFFFFFFLEFAALSNCRLGAVVGWWEDSVGGRIIVWRFSCSLLLLYCLVGNFFFFLYLKVKIKQINFFFSIERIFDSSLSSGNENQR